MEKKSNCESIKNYNGSLDQLTDDINDLGYDCLKKFLKLLSDKIDNNATKEKENNNLILASKLYNASKRIEFASIGIGECLKIN